MTKKNDNQDSEPSSSRRIFLRRLGTATAGLLVVPYLKPSGVFAYDFNRPSSYLAHVAITGTLNTMADSYDYATVKTKVQYLFDTLGGISDVVKKGDKVGIKINLTGGSGNAGSSNLKGTTIIESM